VYNFNADKGNENRRSVCSRTLSSRVGSIGASEHKTKRGMVLPFTPLSITFDEIRYAVEMPQVQELNSHSVWCGVPPHVFP